MRMLKMRQVLTVEFLVPADGMPTGKLEGPQLDEMRDGMLKEAQNQCRETEHGAQVIHMEVEAEVIDV